MGKARDFFDHMRVPVNRTAATVLDGRGVHYDPNVKLGTLDHWEKI